MHGARILVVECLCSQRVVAFLEARIVKAHVLRQQAEDFRIRLRFAQRRHGRVVRHHVQMAVGGMRIDVFQLRGGGQHDVGVVDGVRLEVLEHDGKQILAGKTLRHFRGVGRHRQRIRVVDDHGFHLRTERGRADFQ